MRYLYSVNRVMYVVKESNKFNFGEPTSHCEIRKSDGKFSVWMVVTKRYQYSEILSEYESYTLALDKYVDVVKNLSRCHEVYKKQLKVS